MRLGAVLAIFFGVLVGVFLLAEVADLAHLRRLKIAHVSLALVAAGIVCASAARATSAALAWVAALAVVAAGSAGLIMWRRSLTGSPEGGARAPRGLVVAHGAAAAIALVLTVLAAAFR